MSEGQRRGKYGRFLSAALVASDILLFNLTFSAALLVAPPGLHGVRLKLLWLLLNVAIIPVGFIRRRLTEGRSVFMDRIIVAAFSALVLHFICFTALLAFIEVDKIPWHFLGTLYCFLIPLLPAWWIGCRVLIKHVRRRGRNFLRVVITGTDETAVRLCEEMISDSAYGYRVCGFFGPKPTAKLKAPWLGPVENLSEFLTRNYIDEVYNTLGEADGLSEVIRATDANGTSLIFVPQIPPTVPRGFQLDRVGTIAVLNQTRSPLHNPFNRFIKRTLDVVISGSFLLLSPVIFIPVALAIKFSSPGPVFFNQIRTGYHGKPFLCRKFRTMKQNDDADSRQATPDDPRKTPIGNFLRRTSIDELPQFINVLKGEMSIVGPRPHMLAHTATYSAIINKYMARHNVKPGITGWAQVNGYRGSTDHLWQMEKRVECDVWYIENWNLALDIKIIARTVINAFSGDKNAY